MGPLSILLLCVIVWMLLCVLFGVTSRSVLEGEWVGSELMRQANFGDARPWTDETFVLKITADRARRLVGAPGPSVLWTDASPEALLADATAHINQLRSG